MRLQGIDTMTPYIFIVNSSYTLARLLQVNLIVEIPKVDKLMKVNMITIKQNLG